MGTANITYGGSRYYSGGWSSSFSTNGPGSYGTYAGYSGRSYVTCWKITAPSFPGNGSSITLSFDYISTKTVSLYWHLSSAENTDALAGAVGAVINPYGITYGTLSLASTSSQWGSSSFTMSFSPSPGATYYVYLYPQSTGSSYATIGNVSGHRPSGYVSYLDTHTVTYNANGGTGAPASQTKVWGSVLTLSSTIPTRTGYDFVIWNTAANGSGSSYAPGSSYGYDADMTLYAIWEKNPGFLAASGSSWKGYQVYAVVNGKWTLTQPYFPQSGAWKRSYT